MLHIVPGMHVKINIIEIIGKLKNKGRHTKNPYIFNY